MRVLATYIVAALALAGVAAGIYLYMRAGPAQIAPTSSGGASATSTLSVSTTTTTSDSAQSVPSGYSTYASIPYHFSLSYPNDLAVKEYDEGDGAQTITFQDVHSPEQASGFELFVTPYSGSQVTQDRFLGDEPSGVRNNVQSVSVDGASGAAFESLNATLGDTYEIWVIHGGFLYELTTLKALAPLLNTVAAAWKFSQ